MRDAHGIRVSFLECGGPPPLSHAGHAHEPDNNHRPFQSARGLAHSKTLTRTRGPASLYRRFVLREQNQQLREQLEISQGRQSVLFRALNQALSAVEESPYCTSPVSYRKPVKL